MNEPKTVTACLIIIGNEILSGRTRDANLQFLGENLNALGIRLMEGRVKVNRRYKRPRVTITPRESLAKAGP